MNEKFLIYCFSIYLFGYRYISNRYDEFDAKSKVTGQRGIHGHTRGHDDILTTRSTKVLMELVCLLFKRRSSKSSLQITHLFFFREKKNQYLQ